MRETVTDIISIMRSEPLYNPHGDPALVKANKVLKNYADRIEAAHAQEVRDAAMEHAVLPAVCITKIGDAAAMRNALLIVKERLSGMWEWLEVEDVVESALSASSFNADLDALERACEEVLDGDTLKAVIQAKRRIKEGGVA